MVIVHVAVIILILRETHITLVTEVAGTSQAQGLSSLKVGVLPARRLCFPWRG